MSVGVFGLLGLVFYASAELPLILREIAVNTRKTSEDGACYGSVEMLSNLIKGAAYVIWLAGVLYSIFLITQLGRYRM